MTRVVKEIPWDARPLAQRKTHVRRGQQHKRTSRRSSRSLQSEGGRVALDAREIGGRDRPGAESKVIHLKCWHDCVGIRLESGESHAVKLSPGISDHAQKESASSTGKNRVADHLARSLASLQRD